MKEIKTMTYDELSVQAREVNDRLGELYTKAANREFTDEEATQERELTRELKTIKREMDLKNADGAHERRAGRSLEAPRETSRDSLPRRGPS